MPKNAVALVWLLIAGSAMAQTPPAPASRSGGGGAVGTGQTPPTRPTGATPPGTPTANSLPDQLSRDAAGQQVIGHTATTLAPVPGNTGGQGTGTQ